MPERSKSTAFLLCYFLGLLGVHRFYVGRPVSGVLMLLTAGGLLIWWLVDSILILTDALHDGEGRPLRTGPPDPDYPYAGFWVRLAAWSADQLVLSLAFMLVVATPAIYLAMAGIDPSLYAEDPERATELVQAELGVLNWVYLGVNVIYYTAFTASVHQATPGKRMFEIHVRPVGGGRVTLLTSLARCLGYAVSFLTLGAGFAVAALHSTKRSLHDLVAGTEVVYGKVGAEAAGGLRA